MGLNIAGALMSTPGEPGIVKRIIEALSMLTGVLVSRLGFIVGCSTPGWLAGAAMTAALGGGNLRVGTPRTRERIEKLVADAVPPGDGETPHRP